ncbi:Natterin-3 [Orchesella cincta]|uniref:Natterin-3 n=1 Tax=Orchesella cincta TaxID=48709 RepID=A0A1D2MLW7_ORCCI|nr:Natterin-3 [Orchesella cincta]
MEPRQITWVPKSHGGHAKFAVHAGIDSGNKLYVARAHHFGGIVPGKLHIGHSHVYIPYNGLEVSVPQYEVLIAAPGTLSWVDGEGSNIPQHAIQGGRDPNGEPYYIGRVFHQGTITVGKVQRSHGTCYVPHGGKEHGYRNYEILVRNAYGRALNV